MEQMALQGNLPRRCEPLGVCECLEFDSHHETRSMEDRNVMKQHSVPVGKVRLVTTRYCDSQTS